MMLKDRVAVVTGASRGIGRAIAVELARHGARVVVNYQGSEAAAQETLKLCQGAGGGEHMVKQFDVGNPDQVTATMKELHEACGRLDILVNNAGISRDMLIMRFKNEDWDAVLRTNLSGVFYCSRAVSRYMSKQEFGRIVNVSSIVGQMGNAGQVAYSAAKAGIIGMTKTLAKELAKRKVTVNAVAPGFIKTDMTAALKEEMVQMAQMAIPMGELGTPEDIAPGVAFLCSDGARYITGQVLAINGGLYM
ncbi:MAG: 3-oxoacyl-[acyl-carrier-protein] reductase [Deltaproteobacteria bacterium]|nr:3-oxoacyl-[acyl-carrier-protein] reductase [Deltaproteobacteria bacterium]